MPAFEAIASTTLTTTTSTVTFSSIPSTYEHLQLRFYARDSQAATSAAIILRANNDSGSNYARHLLYGTGASALADATTGATSFISGAIPASSALANCFGTAVLDILDYAATNKYTTIRAIHGYDFDNTNPRLYFQSGLWLNVAAVNRFDFVSGGSGFVAGSVFSLYGLRSS